MFWFLLIAMVAVVAAVALAVLGGGDGGSLRDAPPDRLHDPLPYDRPLDRVDVEGVRLPLAFRGYRMTETDEVLDRLAAELTERDARIDELERALAGQTAGGTDRPAGPGPAGLGGAAADGATADGVTGAAADGATDGPEAVAGA
ncbi:DivIVA domain-containing protein [Streptomyces sp. NPDC059740]|uniref:DivIVA domain-containing protein n=1 Tax=Streptomyces sp. NPDC059740 TaxID=3346926 RepID=UPI00365AE466